VRFGSSHGLRGWAPASSATPNPRQNASSPCSRETRKQPSILVVGIDTAAAAGIQVVQPSAYFSLFGLKEYAV
jgi:hypothetical protein